MSIDGRMDKDDVGYVCVCILECIVECYLVLKKEILPFATWMDLEGVMLSETSQKKTNAIRFHI